jgi:hypothetical protein
MLEPAPNGVWGANDRSALGSRELTSRRSREAFGKGQMPSNAPAAQVASATTTTVTIRSVALPNEHGGWGFLIEPLIMGLALAPTPAGGALALSALGAFLMRHPLKLALSDRARGARYPRTRVAERFALGYGAIAGAGWAGALWAASAPFWMPLGAALVLAALQFAYDVRLRGRQLVPEIAGVLATSALAPTLCAAAGWSARAWLALWALLAVRGITATLYVRARLRLERGERSGIAAARVAQLVGVHGVILLVATRAVPWLALVAFVPLTLRAALGLSRFRRPARAQRIGLTELIYGGIFVVIVTLAYRLAR